MGNWLSWAWAAVQSLYVEPAEEPGETSVDTQRETGNPTIIAQKGGVVSSPHVSGVVSRGRINMSTNVNNTFGQRPVNTAAEIPTETESPAVIAQDGGVVSRARLSRVLCGEDIDASTNVTNKSD
ncbi:uncharacterized protein LOC108892179 isoform X2 [Lates calcarifer]|uniref:Uncharacterized protein LOC108892179 isoform X2 n=1 Tax=Lates calcarifer TaxID=8187 RepID=A0AAJ8B616_LATCA|nr:uncharacterized protein LOC108892179 isoform X2 [Lates calcarifer]